MLNNLNIKNFTVFPSANLQFSKHLNVIVGENGSGQTHLLKVAYSALATSWEESRKPTSSIPTKALLQTRIADKLINVFRPESLGRLARRKQGRERCDIKLLFEDKQFNFEFSFSTNSKTEVLIEQVPKGWLDTSPAYIPTRELLSIFPNFVSVYEGHYLEFEEISMLLQELKEQIFKLPSSDRLALVSAIIESLQNQPTFDVDRSGAIQRMRGLLK
jgi:predicted ATP-dependent endonuclease of OLD family